LNRNREPLDPSTKTMLDTIQLYEKCKEEAQKWGLVLVAENDKLVLLHSPELYERKYKEKPPANTTFGMGIHKANTLAEIESFLDGYGYGWTDYEDIHESPPESELTDEEKSITIQSLELIGTTRNILAENNINTIGELIKYSEDELSKIPSMGKKYLRDIKDELAKQGITLRKETCT